METETGAFQSQPFYKGSEGRPLKMRLDTRVQGHEVELTWHGGDGSGRAPPWAEVEYRDGSVRRVEKFKGRGQVGGPMPWQWSVQGGTVAPGQDTKPQEASHDGTSEISRDRKDAGFRGHEGGEGPRRSKDTSKGERRVREEGH